MENNVLVSVIIPVYNVRPYIEEALDSILYQTYGNLEIILIDDGPTDGSGEICDEYAGKDRRVVVVHQENRGLSAARNVGLDRMTGEYVAFLDPDDAYDKAFIENMLSAMLREKADLTIGRYTIHHTTGPLRHKKGKMALPAAKSGVYTRAEALRELAGGAINAGVWNKLYARALWKDIRFPEGRFYEDVAVTYRIIDQCEKVCVLDLPLYMYRKRPGSITETPSWEKVSHLLLAKSEMEAFIEANTPDLFSEEALKMFHQSHIKSMMAWYTLIFRSDGIDRKTTGEKLRKHIVKYGEEIGIESFGCRCRTGYRMICACPWLLRVVYPIYRPIRNGIRYLFGR